MALTRTTDDHPRVTQKPLPQKSSVRNCERAGEWHKFGLKEGGEPILKHLLLTTMLRLSTQVPREAVVARTITRQQAKGKR